MGKKTYHFELMNNIDEFTYRIVHQGTISKKHFMSLDFIESISKEYDFEEVSFRIEEQWQEKDNK